MYNVFDIPEISNIYPSLLLMLATFPVASLAIWLQQYTLFTSPTTQLTKTVLITAISKPKRLLEYLPKDIKMISFPDHYTFTKEDILKIQEENKDFSFVTTGKDFVKLKEFNIKNLYLMDLDIEISQNVDFSLMEEYIKGFNK